MIHFYAINLIKMKVPLCASIGGTSGVGRFITISACLSFSLVEDCRSQTLIGRCLIISDAHFL